jgi:hypothetical protein
MEAVVLYQLDWLEAVGARRRDQVFPLPQVARRQRLGARSARPPDRLPLQAITGVILAMFYKPDPDTRTRDRTYNDVTFSWLVRGILPLRRASSSSCSSSTWPASSCTARTVPARAELDHRRAAPDPRHVRGFTGYLLPFDQTAYWATVSA